MPSLMTTSLHIHRFWAAERNVQSPQEIYLLDVSALTGLLPILREYSNHECKQANWNHLILTLLVLAVFGLLAVFVTLEFVWAVETTVVHSGVWPKLPWLFPLLVRDTLDEILRSRELTWRLSKLSGVDGPGGVIPRTSKPLDSLSWQRPLSVQWMPRGCFQHLPTNMKQNVNVNLRHDIAWWHGRLNCYQLLWSSDFTAGIWRDGNHGVSGVQSWVPSRLLINSEVMRSFARLSEAQSKYVSNNTK